MDLILVRPKQTEEVSAEDWPDAYRVPDGKTADEMSDKIIKEAIYPVEVCIVSLLDWKVA